ncbi:glycosyltransferase [Catenibacterium mitsuokai]|uniref:Glycosyltransferase n=1 Tax=Catenibacterium mitsuokai TaxID=100886 RepID=A0ABS6NHX5_9FIRM|nr:glycosyltransferase [Catenibacterium mitsuokai]MBV3376714.1 glycosyltransferase [Catenibacterium mitsuokai]MBV3381231.1 glycosyltransferase [Catenibacterium mitsuokai]MBV3391271.1 glycosyltransferase [Catenibacterium mitsuokai]MBV3393522.1 glycosyltransferase [Catenibacterium mitsuokai]
MSDFFKHHHYDIIWFNACDLGNLGLLKYAYLSSPEKVIVHAHNNDFMQKGKKALFYKFMHYRNKKKVKQYATDYFACSELAGEFFFEDEVRQSPHYHIINNAIDSKRFKFVSEMRNIYRRDLHLENKITIINTARFNYQKNLLFLIDIFEELKNRDDRFELVLVGDGELRGELEQKISDLNLTDSVQLLGLRSDIPELLSAADIFLFPSRFEGFGISLLEAQASGLLSFTSKTVVPESVGITDLLTYISLDESPVEWADMIYSQFTSRDIDRNKYTDIIKEKGFDIDTEAKRLKSYLDD